MYSFTPSHIVTAWALTGSAGNRTIGCLLGALAIALGAHSPALATHGALMQLAGTDGCVSETGTGGACADGKALSDARKSVVSADGANVYVASAAAGAVAVFARDGAIGKLTQLAGTDGCVSDTGSGGACADGTALGGPFSVAISPDDKHVYVASFDSDAVAAFARDGTTGKLTQLAGADGCVSETGTGGACTDGKALLKPVSVAVSADGANVYVASRASSAVAVFARDATTGKLTQLAGTDGCISETGSGGQCADGRALFAPFSLTVSQDGKSVYVASEVADTIAVLARDATTGKLTQSGGTDGCVSETGAGACTDAKALDGVIAVAVSPDGANAYAASAVSDAVAAFARDGTTGALTQLAGTDGCVSESGTGGLCAIGKALNSAVAVGVSPNGKNVYVASNVSDAVAAFARDGTTGTLSQLPGKEGCVSETGTGGACSDGKALDIATDVAISADSANVYVTAQSGAVAVFALEAASARLWIGLRNSDAVGLRQDVRVNVLVNSVVVASGQLDNAPTGSSGFNRALLQTIPLNLADGPVEAESGDELSITVAARRTCSGGGPGSGALRLWYDGQPVDGGPGRNAGSRFDASIVGVGTNEFLRDLFALSPTAGSSRTFAEVVVNSTVPCPDRPFQPFGTWTMTVP